MNKYNSNLRIKKEDNTYIVYDYTNNDYYAGFIDNLKEALNYIAWNNMSPESQKEYLSLVSNKNKDTIASLYIEPNND